MGREREAGRLRVDSSSGRLLTMVDAKLKEIDKIKTQGLAFAWI